MFLRALLGKHKNRAGELAEQVDYSSYVSLGPGLLLPRWEKANS